MQLEEGDKAMSLFLKYGGLPYLKDLPQQDNIVFEYLRNIYSTIAIRDIVNRYSLRNVQFLEQLTQFWQVISAISFPPKKSPIF